ncbi:capsular biosynthesis protein [Roseomonas sp. BN140053]|uniref:capsular biosynthesis protein n=1 Tax=Roseomonas sp. BN140053 TaxID=3391898 RepID=UPI0039EA0045
MIVFPMAGLSSRFTRAGYDRPKWMLDLAGRPLLDWSLLGFRALFEREPFLIVHLDAPGVAEFVRDRVAALGIRRAELVPLAKPTRGQAETVVLGLDAARPDEAEPLTIFNIDTIRPNYAPPAILAECDGWLECFEGEGDHWSFVRPAEGPGQRAAQVTEKVRVSSLCCTGLYYFGSVGLFRDALVREEAAPGAAELYVAPLYQHLLADGSDVRYGVVPPEEVIFSGTPAEYEAALRDTATLRAAFGE